jgi:hypothetical protein
MRLWTIHPKYLDAKGLVALWREALLAQKVLQGKTKGYTQHPQLLRFKTVSQPAAAVAAYLVVVQREASRRGYQFDATKITKPRFRGVIDETGGQLLYEWKHLLRKLKARDPKCYSVCCDLPVPELHPLFRLIKGEVRDWEKVSSVG